MSHSHILSCFKRIKCIRKKDFSVFEKEENKDYSVTSSSSTIQVLVSDLLDTSELTIFTFNSVASANRKISLKKTSLDRANLRNFSGGREIAVKRLSEKSKQGLEEFKNEILLIDVSLKTTRSRVHAKQELGQFHFRSLDRRKRWDIIGGIARGLLYLHRDSRLQIIYHDPQATNILLDREVNPKISDFGMARIFNYRQDQANTIRVKSVVYSFGVLILEIVSESKNVSFRGSEYGSLIGYNLWRQRKTKELIDPTVKDTKDVNEAMRRIHMGMLCTQASVIYGPNISLVLLMLESRIIHLPRPRKPTFHSFFKLRRDRRRTGCCHCQPYYFDHCPWSPSWLNLVTKLAKLGHQVGLTWSPSWLTWLTWPPSWLT
ncbi:hypothetical protein YC2023_033517 [Brassica napus]